MSDSSPDDEPSSETRAGRPDDRRDDRPDDVIEPSTARNDRPPAASTEGAAPRASGATSRHEEAIAVDSKWWYWVAAVPIYVAVGILGGIVAGVLFLLGFAVDIGGGMGIATGIVTLGIVVGSLAYGLVGLVLAFLFPLGIYKDAMAIEASTARWEPDSVLYLVVAAASVLVTAFAVSAVVALYYLYRRHEAIGTP
ncbi:MAG: hypothetical protein U9O06_07570 [Euryarchaeota archaeon]|nr:hypothetical protein [Euryarchaeota archaeon]